LLASWIATVLEAPLMVIVDVPFVNVVPVPLVSQFPETVHEPLVSVIVPLVVDVIVTLPTVTDEAFAVNVPPVAIVRSPPPETVLLDVSKVFAMVNVPVRLMLLSRTRSESVEIVPEMVTS